ncbi:sugar ABC transporter permease [Jiangella ureilytica]|uniref:Sugar ABC transporter permease n=1 Tax=Jiangella ureilytica TaxID=2530374 RepID=A0A4V6PB45_9ACTN|nr:sugar ABC transporter permease [Jiangella ureilytica]TDC51505.1 sugar ABC transporter permease [Jiangella ureilytica]
MALTRTAPGRARTARARPPGSGASGWRRRRDAVGLVFALPALVLFAAFAIYPMLRVFQLSLYDYNLTSPPVWVGLDNFRFLFGDERFLASLGASLFYVVVTYGPAVLLALVLALGLNTRMRGSAFVRLLYFAPVATSWVAVSVIWRLVLQPEGLLNQTLNTDIPWLTSSSWAKWAIAIAAIWKEVGFFLIIFLAGLQNIPKDLQEAAALDGAGSLRRLRYVTLPLLKPITVVVLVMAVIRGFQSFSPQVVLTGGSFGTEVINLFVYKTAFASARMGRASAVAVLMFVLLLMVTFVQLRALRKSA